MHTIGGVVTPPQALLVVVPLESHPEVEAMVSNRDTGFVSPGQDAEIKVDTNFTRYGLPFWRARRDSNSCSRFVGKISSGDFLFDLNRSLDSLITPERGFSGCSIES